MAVALNSYSRFDEMSVFSMVLCYLAAMGAVLVGFMMLLNSYLQPAAVNTAQRQPLPAIGHVAAVEPAASPTASNFTGGSQPGAAPRSSAAGLAVAPTVSPDPARAALLAAFPQASPPQPRRRPCRWTTPAPGRRRASPKLRPPPRRARAHPRPRTPTKPSRRKSRSTTASFVATRGPTVRRWDTARKRPTARHSARSDAPAEGSDRDRPATAGFVLGSWTTIHSGRDPICTIQSAQSDLI